MAWVYYNEFDKNAAAWLRELIKDNLIAPGEVDERSIEDVLPNDLKGFTQCHFFAGIGGWSAALRLAGWPDGRPVWTGSCPCQPFSSAGKGEGFADERHLWPAWHHLIGQRKPPVIFGEQVESAIRHGWLDLVQDDLEGLGYAFGASGLPAACVGAPHIRQRLWFVADNNNEGLEGWGRMPERAAECASGPSGLAGRLGDSISIGRQQQPDGARSDGEGVESGGWQQEQLGEDGCGFGRLADAKYDGYSGSPGNTPEPNSHESRQWVPDGDRIAVEGQPTTGPLHGFWRDADWLFCRDGKWRPVEPGTFPLADGVSNRVGRLRAYGNAIVPQVAQIFIEEYMRCRP